LESTNEAYAWAKLAGIAMVKAYRRQYGFRGICLMPTNLYGPGDRFDDSGHLVPSLMRRMHEAKVRGDTSVTVWGTGTPRRELLHVDDLARACVHLMNTYEGDEIVNVGTGIDLSVAGIAALVRDVVGFTGQLLWDSSKPDGTPRKVLDVSRANALGWEASVSLRRGLEETYAWYVENQCAAS
jgi:GDP-L-fucose synthase